MTSKSTLKTIGLLAAGIAGGAGGTWLALKPRGHADLAPAESAQKQMYQCPMHPQIIMDHEGDCPICGMKLVAMEAPTEPAKPGAEKGKILFYRNPMDPTITSPVFMKDSMGMDYVPVYENESGGAPGASVQGRSEVKIDTQRQQLIGMKTAPAVEGDLGGGLRTVGRVTVDETRVRKVNVKVEGFVEKLFVDFTGQAVGRGQPLLSLYSPEFVSAQQEFLLALRTRQQLAGGSLQGSGDDLLESARRRLTLWDVPASELERLEQTGEVRKILTLRAPVGGVVTVKNVVEGARVTPSDFLYEITDLGRVWVQADVYESELSRVRVGTEADLSLGAYHGRTFRGRVAFVDPQADPKTRTVKVRIEFPNPKGELKPEMFGQVELKTKGRKGLTVPIDAVLDSGTRKVVFVALGEGRFEPREVQTGASLGERIEILGGVKAGEEVVTRANFLVDSESRLKAALAQMTGGTP